MTKDEEEHLINLIGAVRKNVKMHELASHYTSLQKAGQYFVGLCPLCKHAEISFRVTRKHDIFSCLSCNQGGDTFSLIEKIEKLDFVSAVAFLAEKYKITV